MGRDFPSLDNSSLSDLSKLVKSTTVIQLNNLAFYMRPNSHLFMSSVFTVNNQHTLRLPLDRPPTHLNRPVHHYITPTTLIRAYSSPYKELLYIPIYLNVWCGTSHVRFLSSPSYSVTPYARSPMYCHISPMYCHISPMYCLSIPTHCLSIPTHCLVTL